MKVIAVASMKGGVGKTTTTANLASVFREAGDREILVVDLDPQNSLHLHFNFLVSDNEGICSYGVRNLSLSGAVRHNNTLGFGCLPYGAATEDEREVFESLLQDDPNWLCQKLADLGLPDNTFVIIDTPPGNTVYLQQAFNAADIVLLVILADAGSYLTLPAMEGWLAEANESYPTLLAAYVVNQTDNGNPLHRDLLDVLRFSLKGRLAPVSIHRDEGVSEAMAFQQSVIEHAPHAQATEDFRRLADWVAQQLTKR